MGKVFILRVVHGLFAMYFILCLGYLYYAAISAKMGILLLIVIISFGVEGLIVFVLNKGDCPLIYIQRRLGDDTPFFNLFFPPKLAKQAIPIFVKLTWLGVALLIIRWLSIYVGGLTK